ncbi:MAG: adenosylcobalamin-dependent ribonucleoside-diphosphate reductase [Zestosphaera sp.]
METLRVTKRSGVIESFKLDKLTRSVHLAMGSAGLNDPSAISGVMDELMSEILKVTDKLTTSKIADLVEKTFISKVVLDSRYELAARHYLLARIYNDVYGKNAWTEFSPEDSRLSYYSLKVLSSRYLLKDPSSGKFVETPKKLFERVAKHIASAETKDREKWFNEFYRLMSELKFIPNSPTLMNAGTRLGILSACFVLPVRDSMVTPEGEGIYDAIRAQAIVFQQGGGTGFSFSELRPEGDVVSTTASVASGPLSFMKLFDVNTDVVKQGGRRRGANMGTLHVWHPDIMKFIKSKSGELKDKALQNFNISVGVYDWFFKHLAENRPVPLINPRKTSIDGSSDSRKYAVVWARHYMSEEWVQEVILDELEEHGGSIPLDESVIITWDEALAIAERENAIVSWEDPKTLFQEIVKNAWDSGDPGLLFIDTINRRHPTWYIGKINATNPCGEEPLLEWESCNLGSINLERYVHYVNGNPVIDWDSLGYDVRVAVRFLDNVIDVAKWPLPQLEKATKRTRKVGLGVMGWAHMLIRLGIPFDSVDALYLAYYLGEWIAYNAYKASIELAAEKGAFPAWNPKLYRPFWLTTKSLDELLATAGIEFKVSDHVKTLVKMRPQVSWDELRSEMTKHGLRNATLLSIAPTGTISIIAGTSSSIEPIFALAFTRVVTVGTFIEVNTLFLDALRGYGLDDPEVVNLIAESGSIRHNPYMPKKLREIFATAHDVEPSWHVLHQATWQQWVDAGVSKTVNMRAEVSVDDVKNVYLLAWKLGCKGITIYRDRSKTQQVIYFGAKLTRRIARERKVEGVTETIPEATRRESEATESAARVTEATPEAERKTQVRYRIATRYALQEGELGDCFTCEY